MRDDSLWELEFDHGVKTNWTTLGLKHKREKLPLSSTHDVTHTHTHTHTHTSQPSCHKKTDQPR